MGVPGRTKKFVGVHGRTKKFVGVHCCWQNPFFLWAYKKFLGVHCTPKGTPMYAHVRPGRTWARLWAYWAYMGVHGRTWARFPSTQKKIFSVLFLINGHYIKRFEI